MVEACRKIGRNLEEDWKRLGGGVEDAWRKIWGGLAEDWETLGCVCLGRLFVRRAGYTYAFKNICHMFAEGFQPKARESFLGRKPNEGEVELNVLHPSGRMGSISGVADEAAHSSPRIFC